MSRFRKHQASAGICFALALVTLALYWPMTGHQFVNIDDHAYLTENEHVRPGVTWPAVAWAFQTGYAANWHPLTWVSHMLDCQLYGMNPGGHHFTNLLFHIADTLLLFLLLKQMTGSLWRSALVAALFAWHPLHVESVAWASERKDVLSTFFWLLTMTAYAQYVKTRRPCWYGVALVLFALGLMSKPMLVTLPCVLLLIDLWPLGRLRFPLFGAKQSAQEMAGSGAAPAPALTAPRLLIEKLPFFAMAAASSVVTYIAQQKGGAVESLEILPLQSRLVNALVTYPRYIFKTFWPADLTVMYPYEKNWPPALIIGSLLFLALVSGFVVLHVKHQAYLTTGWFWFLGTLVPTIGLVQVGSQSMADRYTYVPGIGLFIMLAWGWHELLFSFAQRHRIFAVTAAAALVGCLVCTRAQLRYWHDSEQLFRHAIAVTTNNYIAYNGLGGALDDLGRKDAALACYLEAVRLDPRYPEARHNLGTALLEKGRWDEAISHLTACVEMNPRFVQARNNLGKALLNAGRLDQARDQLFKTIELKPDYAEARYNLGTLLLMESKLSEAVAQFYQVLRLQPDNEQAHGNLAVALMRQGSVNEGIRHFSEVLRLNPTNLEARFNLGIALLEQSQWDRAAQHFSEALRRKPADARYHYYLAFALTRAGKGSDAVAHYRQALHAQPDFPDALNGLASILSSHADSKLRAGDEAVRLAQKACELTQNKRADMLTTLAAAYAETGRFNEAVATAQKARDVATAAGEKQISAKAEAVLKLAETGQPFRESF